MRGTDSLGQFLKLAAEDVVGPHGLSDFPGNVAVLRSPGVKVGLLEQNQVSRRGPKKTDDVIELVTAINVPTDNPDDIWSFGGARPGDERT
jgi:hypothetical protein